MDPATMALIMGGSQIAGSLLGNKAQEKAAEQSAAQRQANMGLIQNYGQRAVESLTPGYQSAQAIRQQAMNQNIGMAGSTFRPMIESVQSGDLMAQQALLAGLMGQRSAILGEPMNYGALQAQSVPVNYAALSGLTSPQGLQFSQITRPDFGDTAQTDWKAFDARNYLAANPDVSADYNAKKDQLIAGGDPQFRTLEGYAKWHYDNYGKNEGRLLAPSSTPAASAPAASPQITTAQVKQALNAGSGSLNQFEEER
jgi:hypothetical protein